MSKLLRGQIVGELPQTGEPGQLYFLRNDDNTYTQYVADDKGILRKERDAEGLTIEDVKTLITENQDVVKVTLGDIDNDHYFGKVQDVTITNEKGEEVTFKNIIEPKLQLRHDGGGTPVLELEFNDEQFTFDQYNGGIKIKDSAIKAASTDVELTMDEQEVSPQGVVQPINFTITKDGKSETISYDRLVAPQIFAMVGVQQTPTTNEETEMATLFFDDNHFEINQEDRKTIQLKQSILNKLDKLTDEKIDKLLALLEKEEREANTTVGVWSEDEE